MRNLGTFIQRCGSGAKAGHAFANLCNQLLLEEARTRGYNLHTSDDRSGDVYGVDAYSLPTQYGNFEGAQGKVGFQFKCVPSTSSALSRGHKTQIRKSLEKAQSQSSQLSLWILVTPEDFDKAQQTWFDALVTRLHISFPIMHLGHTALVGLYDKYPVLARDVYPDLASGRASERQPSPFNIGELDRHLRIQVLSAVRHLVSDPQSTSAPFLPEVLMRRNAPEDALTQFLQSQSLCFALVGAAGTGKTTFLCSLALRHERPFLIYFLDSKYMVHSLERTIYAAFQTLHVSGDTLELQLQHLSALLSDPARPLVLIIDAINEAPDYRSLKTELSHILDIVRAAEGKVKVFLSCRDVDWAFFTRSNPRLCKELYVHAEGSHTSDPSLIKEQGSYILGAFSDIEFRSAWTKYAQRFTLKGRPNRNIRAICRHPLMLRFLAEAFSGRQVPTDVKRLEILEAYWERKITSLDRASSAEKLLFAVATRLREHRTAELPLDEVEALTGQTYDDFYGALVRVLSEDVLQYVLHVRSAGRAGRRYVSFAYESFHEYALAKLIYRRDAWDRKGAPAVCEALGPLQAEAVRYRSMYGAIELLLLLCEDRQDRALDSLLTHLTTGATEWQGTAIRVLDKVRIRSSVLAPFRAIVDRGSWQRRKQLASALGSRMEDSAACIRRFVGGVLNTCEESVASLAQRREEHALPGRSGEDTARLRELAHGTAVCAWFAAEVSVSHPQYAEEICCRLATIAFLCGELDLNPQRGDPLEDVMWSRLGKVLQTIIETGRKLDAQTYEHIIRELARSHCFESLSSVEDEFSREEWGFMFFPTVEYEAALRRVVHSASWQESPVPKLFAAGVLARRGDDTAFRSLCEALKAEPESVRKEADRELTDCDRLKEHAAALWQVFQECTMEKSPEVKLFAAEKLAERRDERVFGFLCEALQENCETLRCSAVAGLGKFGKLEVVPSLLALLPISSAKVWREVIAACATLEAPQATLPILEFLLESPRRLRAMRQRDPGGYYLQKLFAIAAKSEVNALLDKALEGIRTETKTGLGTFREVQILQAIGWQPETKEERELFDRSTETNKGAFLNAMSTWKDSVTWLTKLRRRG